ncbi:hypothetical protein QVD99_007762 [Batrachochytrium dendrobatidis]|nr:hypothetical protein O5D80_001417 [Batrachochytrium dendrobatidis]KAK5665410.1 hypothetical protein QVD99_007762 [Batrachochytrium dendrobatidis]
MMSDASVNARVPVRLGQTFLESACGGSSTSRSEGFVASASNPKPLYAYHTLKYLLRPDHVDYSKPGVLAKEADNQNWTVTLPGLQPSEPNQQFTSPLVSSKEVECILIYDPETKSYVLEHINSNFNLNPQRRSAQSSLAAHGVTTAAVTNINDAEKSPPQTISRTADSNSSQPTINTHSHSISNINSHTGTKKNTGPRIKLQTIPRSAVQPLSAEPRPAFGASIKKVVSNKSNPEIDKHSIDSSKPKPAEPQPYISSIKVPPPAIPEPVVDSKTLDPVLSDSLEDEYGIDMYMDEALQSPMADFIMDDQLASHEDPHIASNADTVKSTDWEEVGSHPIKELYSNDCNSQPDIFEVNTPNLTRPSGPISLSAAIDGNNQSSSDEGSSAED